MKTSALFVLCAALLLAGCESMSDHMVDRMAGVPPKTQTYAGSLKQVAAAAQVAFKRVDFTITRAKPADLEAVSHINSSAAFADSRQLEAHVHLAETGPGQTLVELTLVEQVQSESLGGSHEEVLKEHSFFSLYFAMLQQVLQEQAGLAAPEKP